MDMNSTIKQQLSNFKLNKNGWDFYSIDTASELEIPLFDSKISAGFPSPADDYIDLKIDFNKLLVKKPAATFCVRVNGVSMKDASINNGDILVVDRSIEPKNNSIAVCFIDGEFTVKRIKKINNEIFLVAENSNYKAIKITEDNDFQIWGIVTYVIHKT